MGREAAPPELAERIRVLLADEQDIEGAHQTVVPFRTRFQWRGITQQVASMAAVCLLSVFGTWAVLQRGDTIAETRHDVVAAHVRSLLQSSTIQVPSSDSHTVRPWFAGKVEFADRKS